MMGPGAMKGQNQAEMMARMSAGMAGNMAAAMGKGVNAPGMGPGGAAGGAPAAAADAGPVDLHSAAGAVAAFLSALKAKDQDRLNEATALRAQLEASTKNQGIFKKIFDLALSDSDLDDLAKKLDGYQIVGEYQGKSTARIEVVLQKPGRSGGYFRRKVTVRHEKKGWGVLDIGGEQNFKSLSAMPPVRGGGGGGGYSKGGGP
jgi:hypothetical protein